MVLKAKESWRHWECVAIAGNLRPELLDQIYQLEKCGKIWEEQL